LASLFGSIHQVTADFLIAQVNSDISNIRYEACPTNQINCNCLINGVFGATVNLLGPPEIYDTVFFQVDAGLCSKGLMDFYLDAAANGDWLFYDHGGDGTKLGTCVDYFEAYGNCSGVVWFQSLQCTSSVCGS
jgi:hypothetical protein